MIQLSLAADSWSCLVEGRGMPRSSDVTTRTMRQYIVEEDDDVAFLSVHVVVKLEQSLF